MTRFLFRVLCSPVVPAPSPSHCLPLAQSAWADHDAFLDTVNIDLMLLQQEKKIWPRGDSGAWRPIPGNSKILLCSLMWGMKKIPQALHCPLRRTFRLTYAEQADLNIRLYYKFSIRAQLTVPVHKLWFGLLCKPHSSAHVPLDMFCQRAEQLTLPCSGQPGAPPISQVALRRVAKQLDGEEAASAKRL
jgi:hypothetical protein